MYQKWPFFRETIDLIAMTLSKADADIAANYEQELIDPSNTELISLGHQLRENLNGTRNNILRVTGYEDLSGGFRLLQRSMKTRYPYVDPLNIIQAQVLKRLRKLNAIEIDEEHKITKSLLEDTLIVSINGISQGMKNSG